MRTHRHLKLVASLMIGGILTGCASIPAGQFDKAPPVDRTFSQKGEYVLGAGDRIEIKVQASPNFDGTYVISPSGQLSFPLVGFVEAKGKAVSDFVGDLEGRLKGFLQDPRVSASVVSTESFKVFFAGQVTKPGVYSFSEKTTLLKAISLAGGPARFSNGRIIVVREDENGKSKRWAIKLNELIGGPESHLDLKIERNDYIYFE